MPLGLLLLLLLPFRSTVTTEAVMPVWWLFVACQTPQDPGKGRDTDSAAVVDTSTQLPPAVQFIRPSDGDTFNSGSTSLELLLTDPDSMAVHVDCDAGGEIVHQDLHNVGAASFAVILKVGSQTLHCVAEDPDTLTGEASIQVTVLEVDLDGDGYGASVDCNDNNPAIHPVNVDYCNGVDDDCDGVMDEDGVQLFYQDLDGDGYGDDATGTLSCAPGNVGIWVQESGDCDDANSDIHPDADEVCDSIDNDCDGFVDNDAVDAPAWYADTDGDGYGDSSTETYSCDQPVRTVGVAGDCNDADAAISPVSLEICDTVDNDCEGTIDENAVDALVWYADIDADGVGDSASVTLACTIPAEASATDGDCDDQDNRAAPGLAEICDSIDNNCDGAVDEDSAIDAVIWYEDYDQDNFGNASSQKSACEQPAGYVADATDCDDSDSSVLDPSSTGTDTYPDADGDGYGDIGPVTSICEGDPVPAGNVEDPGDCDDGDIGRNPGASEVCDGVDQDCDGVMDNAAINMSTWYLDGDGDGYGGNSSIQDCTQPSGTTSSSNDCNDADPAIHPGATEICNEKDDDCDKTVDNKAVKVYYYLDSDGDKYGSTTRTSTTYCNAPTGYVATSTDCNDADSAINPGATEVCNSKDDDCNNLTDDADSGVVGRKTWYEDLDADGYGSTISTMACNSPGSYSLSTGDCDDTQSGLNPATIWYRDSDGDAYGDPGASLVQCAQPAGYVQVSGDCDDAHNDSNPSAQEICDSRDNDCDSYTDDADTNVSNQKTWYTDADGDGYGLSSSTIKSCFRMSQTSLTGGDCNDNDASAHPKAAEVCDTTDNDCDGKNNEDWIDAGSWNLGSAYTSAAWSTTTVGSVTTRTISQSFYVHKAADSNLLTWVGGDKLRSEGTVKATISGLSATGSYRAELTDTSNNQSVASCNTADGCTSFELKGGDPTVSGQSAWSLSVTADDDSSAVCGSSQVTVKITVEN